MIIKSSISDLSEGSVFSTGVYTSTTDFNSDLLTSDSEKLRRSSVSEPNLYENNLSPSSASEAGVIPADVARILRHQHQQQQNHHHQDRDVKQRHHQQQQSLTRTISGDLKEICKIFEKRFPDASKLVKKSYMPRTISGDLGEIRRLFETGDAFKQKLEDVELDTQIKKGVNKSTGIVKGLSLDSDLSGSTVL